MKKPIVDYLAWALLLGLGLAAASFGLGQLGAGFSLYTLIAGQALIAVVNFIYPIAVLRYRVKTGSYTFLNKALHFIALPLCLLMWAAFFT